VKVNDIFVNITSEDPGRLMAFYRDVVGLAPKPEMGEGALAMGPSTLGFDGHSATKGAAKDPTRWLLNLFVDDVGAEEKRLEGQGVKFIRKQGREYWGGVISTFVDPDGNYAQIIEYRPEAAVK
jgi:predicted enzyme related to lactoylglutathione lyase